MYYYMNNPCKIVRDITESLVEVVVCINFADGLEGSSWCEACNISTYASHTCDEYDNVIEQVMEETHEVVCIVEKRLLRDHMIEIKHYCAFTDMITEQKALLHEWKTENAKRSLRARQLDEVIKGSLKLRDELTRQVAELLGNIAVYKKGV